MDPEQIAKSYIEAWRKNDRARIVANLADDCLIVESNGSTHDGLIAITKWVSEWLDAGNVVTRWDIKSIIVRDFRVFTEESFSCVVGKKTYAFEGASVMIVMDGKIRFIKEYKTSPSDGL